MYGSNFSSISNYKWDVVGAKLPNGKVRVVRNRYGSIGDVFESEEDFYNRYKSLITERAGSSGVTCGVFESING